MILLSDDGFVQGGDQRPYGAPAVFKYLPADRIAREIMNLYAEDETRCVSRARRDQCEIFRQQRDLHPGGLPELLQGFRRRQGSGAESDPLLVVEIGRQPGCVVFVAVQDRHDSSHFTYLLRTMPEGDCRRLTC